MTSYPPDSENSSSSYHAAGRAQRQAPSGRGNRGNSRRRDLGPRGRVTSQSRRDWSRAALFRQSIETTRVIKLIDFMGNREYVRQHEHMGLTRHSKVLSVLEKRALRYRRTDQGQVDTDEALFNEALDETGTVTTASLTDSDSKSERNRIIAEAKATSLELEEIADVNNDLFTVHGNLPGLKPDGFTRIMYENSDGFNTRISDNKKLKKAKEIKDELEADIVAYSEHKINCAHKDYINGMGQMFNGWGGRGTDSDRSQHVS